MQTVCGGNKTTILLNWNRIANFNTVKLDWSIKAKKVFKCKKIRKLKCKCIYKYVKSVYKSMKCILFI